MCRLLAIIWLIGFATYARSFQAEKNLQWDFMVFSQEWPPTYCASHRCELRRNVTDFNIHGLWPTIKPDKQISKCKGAPKFNMSQLAIIRPELDNLWMDLLRPKEPNHFWKHEWTKHGTCAFEDELIKAEVDYFETGIVLKKRLNILNIFKGLGLKPSNDSDYATDTMLDLISKHYQVKMDMRCDISGEHHLLKEVRFCFDPQMDLIDCPYLEGDRVLGEIITDVLVDNSPNGHYDLAAIAELNKESFQMQKPSVRRQHISSFKTFLENDNCGKVFRFPVFP